MARTACLVYLISTVNGHSKKKRKKAKNVALVAGTIKNIKQCFFSFDIYAHNRWKLRQVQ